jgi:hypothetical protein
MLKLKKIPHKWGRFAFINLLPPSLGVLFVAAAEVLGLGGGPLSLTSQVKASSFSYCLVDRNLGKSSTLGFNSEPPSDSITTALLNNSKMSTFYYIGLTGMSVRGKPLSFPSSLFEMDASRNGPFELIRLI